MNMVNARAKGMRNERRTQTYLEADGYTIFRLYQPPYSPQGAIDMIAVSSDGGEVLFIQSRSNQWGDLRPLRHLPIRLKCEARKEVWRWDDRVKEPVRRMIA